jgi:osmoprotectant transport system permease protein
MSADIEDKQDDIEQDTLSQIDDAASRLSKNIGPVIPFAGIIWLLVAAFFFWMETTEFSTKDVVNLAPDVELTQVSAEDEIPIVLNTVVEPYFFGEGDDLRFSDVNPEEFVDLLQSDDEFDDIDSISYTEPNRILATIDTDADIDAFIERFGETLSVESVDIPALIIELNAETNPATFPDLFSSVSVVENIAQTAPRTFLMLLSENANAEAIAENNNNIRTATNDVIIAQFVRVDVLLPGEADADEIVSRIGPPEVDVRGFVSAYREAYAAEQAQVEEGEESSINIEEIVDPLLTEEFNIENADQLNLDEIVDLVEDPEDIDTSALRILFENVQTVKQISEIPVTRFEVTPTDGGRESRIIDLMENSLERYFPRAQLGPHLWLPTANLDLGGRIINIEQVDTGLALFWFLVLFAIFEFGMAFYFRNSDEKLIRPLSRVVGVFLVFWSLFGHRPFWDFVLQNIFPEDARLLAASGSVIQFVGEHLELVIVSSLITIPLGLIIGILVTREEFTEFLPLVNNIVNSGQTIPTLAIVAIMFPIIGLGFWPAIIALILYGLLPVVRNTIVGLDGVPASIIDAAKGMGLTPTQILFQIELPIASRIIMAGIRTSMVINVGTAALGAYVASGGLGTPIVGGLSSRVDPLVFLGALPAALLAILIDYVLGRVEFVITPKGLQIEQ